MTDVEQRIDDGRADDADAHRHALTILAREDREETVGDALDEYADRPGVEIRFTGPWPPYSFAPDLAGES